MKFPDNCPGSGHEPTRMVPLTIDGYTAQRGVCPECGTPSRVRNGKVRSHYTPAAALRVVNDLWEGLR